MYLFKKHFHNKSNENNNNKTQTFHPIQKISINSLYPPNTNNTHIPHFHTKNLNNKTFNEYLHNF